MTTVLIVDDDPLIAEAHRTYVERLEGFSVAAVAHTAREAIQTATRATATDQPIDLVLLEERLRGAAFETDARRGFSHVRLTEAYCQYVEEAEREKPRRARGSDDGTGIYE